MNPLRNINDLAMYGQARHMQYDTGMVPMWQSSKFALKLTTNAQQKRRAGRMAANTRMVQSLVKRMKKEA